MSAAAEHAALLQGLELHDELTAAVDERTLDILERRRRTAIVHRRGWLVRRMLLLADVAGLCSALLASEALVAWRSTSGALDARAEVAVFVASLPFWVVIAKLYGLYDRDEERTDHSTADDFAGVFHMVTVCAWLFTVVCYLTGIAHPGAPKLVLFWGSAILLVSLARGLARTGARRSPMYVQNAVVVGAGHVGQLLAKKFLQHPEYGVNVVGFIDGEPRERRDDLEHLALLGGIDRLPAVVRLLDVERVIIAFSREGHDRMLDVLRSLEAFDIQVDVVPRFFEGFGERAGLHIIEGLPLVGLPRRKLARSSLFLKRSTDVCVSSAALLFLGPVLLLIAIAVKLDSRGPVLYRHSRIGHRGKPIEVLKFRTMRFEACRGERYGGASAEQAFEDILSDPSRASVFRARYKILDDPRVTRLGRLLRRFSLDELPQLLNALVGDMSLVGPRAVTADELPRYGDAVDVLLSIRPGITGYWQISGRSNLDYDDRIRLDLGYISNWSISLDLKILARTVQVLLARRGAE